MHAWIRFVWSCVFVLALLFVVDAEARQSGNGVSLDHVIQTYCALPRVLHQDIL